MCFLVQSPNPIQQILSKLTLEQSFRLFYIYLSGGNAALLVRGILLNLDFSCNVYYNNLTGRQL
jgi:hypothetical protein